MSRARLTGPLFALAIAASAGLGGYAIRAAENRPHPAYVAIGVFGIVLAFGLGIVAATRGFE